MNSLSIQIPQDVHIKKSNSILLIRYLQNKCYVRIPFDLIVDVCAERLTITNDGNFSTTKSIASAIKSGIQGVENLHTIYLQLRGIGYKVDLENSVLIFKMGYSNLIRVSVPDGIHPYTRESGTLIELQSADILKLTQFCAKLCRLRKRNSYKEKGLYRFGEVPILKTKKK